MSSHHLRNISVSQFESFLELVHCMDITHNGGHHQKWTRSDLTRQIIFQKKIDPIPEFIVKNNLRVLGYSKENFFEVLESIKEVVKNKSEYILIDCKK